MVSASKHEIVLELENFPALKISLTIDESLQPAQWMTAFLFAKDLFKTELLQSKVNIILMYDSDNPTNEEEIITEKIDKVLIRPFAFADKVALSAMGLKPQTIQVYVNAKGQLIRIVDMEKNGKVM